MSVLIRPITKDDKDQWVDMWSGEDSYLVFYKSKVAPDITEETFRRFLDESEPVYAAVAVNEETGALVGFVTYLQQRNTWSKKNKIYLNDLFVKGDCRLKGTGRKLIEFVYAETDRLDCDQCYWNTQFENHRAQMLYTKVGKKSGFLSYVRPT